MSPEDQPLASRASRLELEEESGCMPAATSGSSFKRNGYRSLPTHGLPSFAARVALYVLVAALLLKARYLQDRSFGSDLNRLDATARYMAEGPRFHDLTEGSRASTLHSAAKSPRREYRQNTAPPSVEALSVVQLL